jgi:hypothetical protein
MALEQAEEAGEEGKAANISKLSRIENSGEEEVTISEATAKKLLD